MADKVKDIAVENVASYIGAFRKEFSKYAPTTELTPQKFRKSRDDLGEIARLQLKYGAKVVDDWGRRNSLKQDGK